MNGFTTKGGKIVAKIKRNLGVLRMLFEETTEIGIPCWKVSADLVKCRLRWGASPGDYLFFRFHELDESQKSSYVTSLLNSKLIATYNKKEFITYFEDKTLFATTFADFFGRDWISLQGLELGGFTEFIADKRYIIYKPLTGMQGRGVEKLDSQQFANATSLYQNIRDRYGSSGIIEDWIMQHESISNIYSEAINPIRVITILQNGDCNILHSTITIAKDGDIAKVGRGGMVAPIDPGNGRIKFPAQDGAGRIYESHPVTGTRILGFEIPYWRDIVAMVDKASKVIPQIGYVGWDVAVTAQGPILIEGNHNPGYRYQQMPAHLPEKIGNRSLYERFL